MSNLDPSAVTSAAIVENPRLTAPKMICLAIRIAGLAGGWARREYGRITPVWSSSGGVMRRSVGEPQRNRTDGEADAFPRIGLLPSSSHGSTQRMRVSVSASGCRPSAVMVTRRRAHAYQSMRKNGHC